LADLSKPALRRRPIGPHQLKIRAGKTEEEIADRACFPPRFAHLVLMDERPAKKKIFAPFEPTLTSGFFFAPK
jgi:hypothetical protein